MTPIRNLPPDIQLLRKQFCDSFLLKITSTDICHFVFFFYLICFFFCLVTSFGHKEVRANKFRDFFEIDYKASHILITSTSSHNNIFYKTILKVQSCKLYNNKCMIASTQTTNTEIFALITV